MSQASIMGDLPFEITVKDETLCRLFIASCYHQWSALKELGEACVAAEATEEELRGTLRHLIVSAGYGPTLKAFNVLHNCKVLRDPNVPGKVCGAPGDAFELVYQGNTNVVRQKMHKVDPVLGELIRVQLYGNIYSSPGISLSQKQLLMVAFLAVYDMPDQLFGHLLAAFRFGNTVKACETAIHIAFEQSGETSPVVLQSAVDTLQQAYAFLQTDGGADWRQVDLRAEVSITDPNSSVTVPDLPEPFFSKEALESEFAWEGL